MYKDDINIFKNELKWQKNNYITETLTIIKVKTENI